MKEYLIPDYYNEFQCKIGECRTPCCTGWPVSLSIDDYFSLTSKECSLHLREKLDRCIKIKLYPTIDSYAEIVHTYTGECPLQAKDGKCIIQTELGEEALSDVCRLYPRGIRKQPSEECSCALSCEKVIELLIDKKSPIRFIKKKINIKAPPYISRIHTFPTMGKEQEIRISLIEKIQNRSLPFYKRILSLGMALHKLDTILSTQDEEALSVFFENKFDQYLPQIEVSKEHVIYGIQIIESVLEIIDKKSVSIKEQCEKTLRLFKESENLFETYYTLNGDFQNFLPEWETFFEHLIVNHMFFEQFPFQDREEKSWEEFVALCSVYALLRFLSLGFIAFKGSLVEYIDMCASFFRFVEHTDFDRISTSTFKKIGCFTPKAIHDLIII